MSRQFAGGGELGSGFRALAVNTSGPRFRKPYRESPLWPLDSMA